MLKKPKTLKMLALKLRDLLKKQKMQNSLELKQKDLPKKLKIKLFKIVLKQKKPNVRLKRMLRKL